MVEVVVWDPVVVHIRLTLTGAVIVHPAQRDRTGAQGDQFGGLTGGFPALRLGNPRLSRSGERSEPVTG
ncbi:hypothetical protein ATKI12_2252 [Kitasatospora sp. Ki12]